MNNYMSKLSKWCSASEDYFDIVLYTLFCCPLYVSGRLSGMTTTFFLVIIFSSKLMRRRVDTLSTLYLRRVSEAASHSYVSKYMLRIDQTKRKNALQKIVAGAVFVLFVFSIFFMHKLGSPFTDSIVYHSVLEMLLLLVGFIVLTSLMGIFISFFTIFKIRRTVRY